MVCSVAQCGVVQCAVRCGAVPRYPNDSVTNVTIVATKLKHRTPRRRGNFSVKPCFKGQMWAGDYCCTDSLFGDYETTGQFA